MSIKKKDVLLDTTLKSGYRICIDDLSDVFDEDTYKVTLKILVKNKPKRGAIYYKKCHNKEQAIKIFDRLVGIVDENKKQMRKRFKFWPFKTHVFKFLMTHRN